MSAGGSFGGNRGLRPVPPEKGVFPLDHMHLCDLEKKEYLNCLKTSGHKSEKCRHLSKKYLECRMENQRFPLPGSNGLGDSKWGLVSVEVNIIIPIDPIPLESWDTLVKNLMAKQDMTELGFGSVSQANLSGDKLEQL
ncbi:cytochrome c oxidase assembly protein COX19-like [Cucumis melo var. makuwa]|uniref:Cytochrome c oxidase assembly protein COX19-like n=1 Tax=Cucumis melo var. makuwa TaxID=1194695 RepID=A0A5D3BXW6_CUCMM|nr:cytochrome c oxidase assembly protein COX19-like [Cucumis melo var. makuwa]